VTRAAVQARLRAIRDRLAELSRAERLRHGRTAYWKARYRLSKRVRGAGAERTKWLLHKYRTSRALGRRIDHTQAVLHRRAELKLGWLRKHPPPLDPDRDGLITIDGRQVATEVGREVLRIRAAGRWRGVVVSGYRTPAYSERLCYGMCGRPQCPGRCAGRATNHARKGGRNGAVDVTDYYTFRAECKRLGSWLENHLPQDLVHFSDSGN
jgi:hypothetical protein